MREFPIRVLWISSGEDDVLAQEMAAKARKTKTVIEQRQAASVTGEALAQNGHDACLINCGARHRQGLEIARSLQAKGNTAPIILLIDKGTSRLQAQAAEVGVTGCLERRRLTLPHLERSVRSALEHATIADSQRDAQKRLGSTPHRIREGVWEWNLETHVVWCSLRQKEMLGYAADEIGPHIRCWRRLLHPDDRTRVLNVVDGALRNMREYQIEFRLRHKDGHYRDIVWRGFPVRAEAGGPIIRVVGTHFDLLERGRAEEVLPENERRYRAIADCSYDWESWVNVEGRPEWISPSVERVTGYSIEECLALPNYPLPLIHEDDREAMAARCAEALEGKTLHDERCRVRRKDGSVRWISVCAQPLCDERGSRMGYRASIRDVTLNKQAEDDLERTRECLQNILDSSLDMIITVDKNRRVFQFNRAAESALGYSAEEVIGRPVQILYARPEEASSVDQTIRKSGRFCGEIVNRTKSGRTFVSYLQASRLHDRQGHDVGVMGISRDITERKQVEAERAAMLEAMKRSHADLIAILDQLRESIVMTDCEGRVTFVSRNCRGFLGDRMKRAEGTQWTELFPLSPQDKATLQAMADRLPYERTKIPVHMHAPQGQRYVMEMEVLDDPRDPGRKIFFIHDVTEVHDLRSMLDEKNVFHDLVGQSQPMQTIAQRIRDLAKTDATVLIEGETGTGKELVAHAIHAAGSRANRLFLPVNCAGLTESLIASQLFGHKRGAFTGAFGDHRGVFETAQGGTVLLDEIGDLPLSMQASLLRVLQEKEITRLGESTPRRVDVRILAATHQNLDELVLKGRFRKDLLYRIRVARIGLPPLRHRREDIPLLVQVFLSDAATRNRKPVASVSEEVMQRLLEYDWPGNVRELQSAIEFACIASKGTVVRVADLPPELKGPPELSTATTASAEEDARNRLLAAIRDAKGSRTNAARLLGISRATLYRHLNELHLDPDSLQ